MNSEELEEYNKKVDKKEFILAHEILLVGIIITLIDYLAIGCISNTVIKTSLIWICLYIFALCVWKFVEYRAWNVKIVNYLLLFIITIVLPLNIIRFIQDLLLLI